jgi:hypothetical protein
MILVAALIRNLQRQALANTVGHLENSGRSLVSQRIFPRIVEKPGPMVRPSAVSALIIELEAEVVRRENGGFAGM